MAVPSYPLARPPAGTDVHSLPVEKVSQAILFSQLRAAELMEPGGTLILVRLIPDFIHGGWRVRWEFGTIGSVPAPLRGVFPELERIHQAQCEPLAWARVSVNKERGLLDVALELPSPELAVPWNSLVDGTRLLPQGGRLPATLTGENRQMLGQVDGVDVWVEGEVVGQLEYVPLEDGALGVRVFVVDGESFIDIGVGDVAPVPVLPERVVVEEAPAPPAPASPASPTLSPQAPWDVTVPGEELAEPNPTGPRRVLSPVVLADSTD